jgi:primosomal protein N' (replication factor Y)
VRARRLGIRVVLASATPSLESLRNAYEHRYDLLTLPKRIGRAGTPAFRTVDLNVHATRQGLSTPLLASIDTHLEKGNQVLLFLNRRGFAPALFCPQCRTAEECDRCDARMTVHARSGALRCHHCGRERALHWACARCGSERIAVGAGTERVTDVLQSLYPDRRIARLDRDVTARRGALAAVLEDVERGATQILVGTQMLTKGHDFPRVTLVGILNADQGLFGTDFRSDERLAQTIVQVAGRAGRRDQPGEVVIQTHFPEHPLLRALQSADYTAFAKLALEERRLANWPPFSHLAVWRAAATVPQRVFDFLTKLSRFAASASGSVQILGPAPAAMERSHGHFHGQLLFQSRARKPLHALVATSLAAARQWPEARRVRWSIDIDPGEI